MHLYIPLYSYNLPCPYTPTHSHAPMPLYPCTFPYPHAHIPGAERAALVMSDDNNQSSDKPEDLESGLVFGPGLRGFLGLGLRSELRLEGGFLGLGLIMRS